MHPERIKAELRMKGVTPTALADELGVANSTVSQVISGRSVSARIRARIAQITGYSVDVLWPKANARPVLRRTRAAVVAARAGVSA
jgi:lambda repressor-like predicted transcriptional regulator